MSMTYLTPRSQLFSLAVSFVFTQISLATSLVSQVRPEACCRVTHAALETTELSTCLLLCPIHGDVISPDAPCPPLDVTSGDTNYVEPKKLICAGLRGHVKSGTTWLGNLTANLLKHHCSFTGKCTYAVRKAFVAEDLSALVNSQKPTIRWFESYDKHIRPDAWPESQNAIVVLRDPREVVASLWHFNHRPTPISYSHPSTRNLYFELKQAMDWIEAAFNEALEKHNNTSLLFVKYSSLVKEPLVVLEQMAHFLGLDDYGEISPESLLAAFEHSDAAKVFTFREGKTCAFVKEFAHDVMYHLNYWQEQNRLVSNVFPISCTSEVTSGHHSAAKSEL
ncbi:hypothetical protein CYMTET_30539 [Cymbomonas tetramitiformis]|uniref:Sulfotransferase n=1 Tax=Cymbomonas tetramitiformis TaxID=36881 RepID=A0AAE0FIV5_9CHLO|nr:hypothetical protein CYMTET_30539 [Cymbomonas tetramitiformis]